MGSFIPCIQMDAYPYEHSPKRKVVPAPYFQLLQAVVVQYAVVDTLTGCTFAVYFLVFFGISWNPRMEAEVAVILYVDGAFIFSGGTFSGMGGGRNLCGRISAGSGICVHLLWDHYPMDTFYARQGRRDVRFCQK